MSLDLTKLEQQVDEALAAETEESLAEWMAQRAGEPVPDNRYNDEP